jgi:Permuted papain-like amidase enzyme, YaeF/YiiX, C92 family
MFLNNFSTAHFLTVYSTLKKYIITSVLLTLIIACTHQKNNGKNTTAPALVSPKTNIADSIIAKNLIDIETAKPLLQSGMLIMRSDDDYESLTLQNFSNTDKVFSHAGLLFKEDSGFVVYHSMTGVENPKGTIRKDSYDVFVNPKQKTGFGIFKYSISEKEVNKLHQIIKKGYDDKIPFDMFFNLKTDDSLYCSEMIYKGLKKATNNRIIIPNSFMINFKPKIMGYKYNSAFLKRFEYIALDNLYLNAFCKEVKRVSYR